MRDITRERREEVQPPLRRFHQARWDEPVIFELSREGQRGILVPDTEPGIRAEVGDGFPEKVTAFHPEMAVHGRFGQQCPVCGAPVQRIVHADDEDDYCPRCQTGGRILADRALSRLLKDDRPKTLADLEG